MYICILNFSTLCISYNLPLFKYAWIMIFGAKAYGWYSHGQNEIYYMIIMRVQQWTILNSQLAGHCATRISSSIAASITPSPSTHPSNPPTRPYTMCMYFRCTVLPQIARFMGPAWGPPMSCRPRWAPCLPHEPCYQGPAVFASFCGK